MSIQLSKRMQAVADMVTKGNVVADIGCDHGFVPIYLVENEICPRAIAMDVNDGPLVRVQEHVASRNLLPYITIRQSDGACNLLWEEDKQKTEADTIIIAGMGGRLVNRILKTSFDKIQTLSELILQPQSDIFLVRKFLYQNGFRIVEENMVYEDGKYYQMFRAVPAQDSRLHTMLLTVEEHYGAMLLQQKNKVLYQYLQQEQKKYITIEQQMQSHKTSARDGKLLMKQKQALINEALGYFEGENCK